ncbi:MAG: AMP-binding enzyme, partial [Thermodesulfobacteriota bacterium]
LPGVSEAVVVGVADAILGCALKAFIVPELGWDLSERRIRGYCSAHLEPFMVPKYVCVCPTLPRSANGKVDKKALMVGD